MFEAEGTNVQRAEGKRVKPSKDVPVLSLAGLEGLWGQLGLSDLGAQAGYANRGQAAQGLKCHIGALTYD